MDARDHEINKWVFIRGCIIGFMVGGAFVGIVALVSMAIGKATLGGQD
jgi:ATP-dependent protease Clp ATPase subunit